MRLTQKELARMLGVDRTTVTKALANSPGISAAMRERVMKACADHGYVTDYSGRSLSTRQTRVIAVGRYGLRLHDGISVWLDRLDHEAHMRGYRIRLESIDGAYIALREASCDGAIIFQPPVTAGIDMDSLHTSMPVVVVDCGLNDNSLVFVTSDNAAGGAEAVSHLVSLGHSRLCFVGLIGWSGVCCDRYSGFEAKCAELGLFEHSHRVVEMSDWPVGLRDVVDADVSGSIIAAMRAGVTGFCCASDICAIGVARLAKSIGLGVPKDISVVGYDNSPVTALVEPMLTSVDQNIEQAAGAAIDALVAAIAMTTEASQSRAQSPAAPRLVTPKLIVRESTGPITPNARRLTTLPAPTS